MRLLHARLRDGAVRALSRAARQAARPRGASNDWIAGNLCRCTGYRPIVDAALAVLRGRRARLVHARRGRGGRSALAELGRRGLFIGTGERFFAAPASIDEPGRRSMSRIPTRPSSPGATDVGLWITKQLRDLPKIIWLGRVRGLDRIEDTARCSDRSARRSRYAEADAVSRGASIRDLGELMRRFGGEQVRAIGTVGGNIANGSPIGDTPPALIALGATLELQRGAATRARCRWKISSSTTASRTAQPGEFVAQCASRSSGQTNISAATRFPSASTRTFPP